MKNLKSKMSLGVVLALIVMSLSSVFAADVNYIMNLTAQYGGKNLAYEEEIKLKNSDKNRTLTIDSGAKFVDDSLTIYYTMGKGTRYTVSTGKKVATMEIPNNLTAGYSYWIGLEAVSNNVKDNYIGNSNIFYVKVTCLEDAQETTVKVHVTKDGVELKNGETMNEVAGKQLIVSGTSNLNVKQICYKWNNGELVYVNGASATISIPSGAPGSTQRLDVTAQAEDGKWAGSKTFYFTLPAAQPTATPTSKPTATPTATPTAKPTVVPTTAPTAVPTVKPTAVPTAKPTAKPTPVVPVSDDLDVEDWMKESADLDTLAVSLRNDSEDYDKENKNIYALNEEVVYFVDYKNGGRDIDREVKLVLELPLNFVVVDSFGGTVDKENKTITWVMKDGLEKDACGTKVVKVKYTALSKANKKFETVYPVAKIYSSNTKSPKDSSAVINLIFKDEKTEINDTHYPYMIGDKNVNTFRPDEGITRAEGALVLSRIFGVNTTGVEVIGIEFTDIKETYLEAQKAIIACSKLNLLAGFPDGSYRPNEKMTIGQFMRIVASYVEVKAEEDNIKGLEIKDGTESIKVYRNSTNVYIMGGDKTANSHWAIPYVTLLARINMTPVSSSNKNLRLDDEITRAEVAQLVNFYLLRAPQEEGRVKFSDVSRNHKLYADILEATMPAHNYTLTHEGTEVAIDD